MTPGDPDRASGHPLTAGLRALIGSVLAFVVVRRVATRPVPVFRMVAAGALLVSFIPDVLLLTEQGAANFPGATVAGVGLLVLMHVVAAATIVRCLEGAR